MPAIGGGGLLGLVFAASSFFVPMIPFCAFRHITTAIGPGRMRALLLGSAEPGADGRF